MDKHRRSKKFPGVNLSNLLRAVTLVVVGCRVALGGGLGWEITVLRRRLNHPSGNVSEPLVAESATHLRAGDLWHSARHHRKPP